MTASNTLIEPGAAISFLNEAAGYFARRPTNGEDSAYWANVANAETCRLIAVLIAKVEALEGKEEGSAGADLSPASRSHTPLSAGLRDISGAPKDRTPILAKFRDNIYPGIRPGRDDLEPWNGRWVVIHHPGVTADGFDIGWSVSAPVGNGGFPDEWIEGWAPLPPAESSPSGAQRSELAISAPDDLKSNEADQ
ncbi:MAG TPA: hypothetical protein VIO94_16130 [Phenylobacterium sp.]